MISPDDIDLPAEQSSVPPDNIGPPVEALQGQNKSIFLVGNKSNRTMAASLLDTLHGSIERQQTTASPEVAR